MNGSVELSTMMADIRKREKREIFCKQMWMDIIKKKGEFRSDVGKYREKMKKGRVKNHHLSKGGEFGGSN